MAQAGIEEVGIIIAPETGDEIRAAAGDGSRFGVRITYIVAGRAARARPRGAHRRAVPRRLAVRDVPRRQPAPGRDRGPRRRLPRRPARRADPAHAGARPRALRRRRAAATARVVRLVEKPAEPQTNLALVGVYMFTPIVHDAARAISRRPAASSRSPTRSSTSSTTGRASSRTSSTGWWKDTGRLDDMLAANRLVLDTIEGRVDGELIDSQVDGRVVVEAGARLERSTVRGPAIIGAGARLTDCYVGPYTAIGEGCVIQDAEVEHSILLAGSVGPRPRRADGVLAAGPQRQDRARPSPAARLPIPGRRQLRDRHSLARPCRVSAAWGWVFRVKPLAGGSRPRRVRCWRLASP